MTILLLGGYRFLGRAIVDAARGRDHAVTIFSRGSTRAAAPADVEWIVGDRTRDLDRLGARTWDAAIDTCGYLPADVAASTERLRDATAHYTFVSSISAYATPVAAGLDETAPVAELPAAADLRELTGETSGALKVRCERAAEAAMPGRVLHVRAGAIVGPHDGFDRFTYWLERAARGGDMLAPGRPERRVQLIDVGDLAAWIVASAEVARAGFVNATGPTPPSAPITMGDLVDACLVATRSTATVTWVDETTLRRANAVEDQELPFWEFDETNGLFELDLRRACDFGLTTRPLAATASATYAWTRRRDDGARRRGLDPEKEARILASFRTAAP